MKNFIFIVLIVVLSGIVIFYQKSHILKTQLGTPTPTLLDQQFLLYTHPKYHYSFQYPKDWVVKNNNADKASTNELPSLRPLSENTDGEYFEIVVNPPQHSSMDAYQYVKQEHQPTISPQIWDETIDGRVWVLSYDSASQEPGRSLFADTKDNGVIYEIKLIPYSGDRTNEWFKMFEFVLKTFQLKKS